ncbi:MAG: hypothetical protein PF637_07175 [Spirochaetes bacterium]|jgi:uncharacterized membrane protein YbaN (DUF454 family)|nr:hypothetical protein [Spirochaetota bacterium]
METYFLPIISIVAGVFFIVRNVIFLRNEGKLRKYLESSPKAKLWVSKFGVEKTVSLSKKIFLPLGCVIGTALLITGIWSLSKII